MNARPHHLFSIPELLVVSAIGVFVELGRNCIIGLTIGSVTSIVLICLIITF